MDVKLIAFYLPQFHPIPENDRWWGKGFTEWTNVTRARPNFVGHYQPHLPRDLGFYDLRVPEVREEQAALAREYGIYGFCYYYYWFGGRRLLERPLQEVVASGRPEIPFCVCWANENWTRTWDGADTEILIGQQHSAEDSRAFIQSLVPLFQDPRYICVDGAPILLVYRVDLIPDVAEMAALWREECRARGIDRLHLCAVQSFGIGDPRAYGFDAAVEFPPHGTDFKWNINDKYDGKITNDSFCGNIIDINRVVQMSVIRPMPDYQLYRGVMPSWDNTARRQDTGLAFVNSSPERYEQWLAWLVRQTRDRCVEEHRLIFVNAWNEWAEGCHLEPDQKYGLRYLEATRRALLEQQSPESLSFPEAREESRPEVVETVAASDAGGGDGRPRPVLHWLRNVLRSIGRPVYRWLPVEQTKKEHMVDVLFTRLSVFFRGTSTYEFWRSQQIMARETAKHSLALLEVHCAGMPDEPTEELVRALRLPAAREPKVSIIIPVYNKIEYTVQCLRSIVRQSIASTYEIIVVDDCSTDATRDLLPMVQGLVVIRNEVNLGFLKNCNKAAALARGEFIVFLNNDTEVQAGWLDELLHVFDMIADAGLAGSKLIYADGRLQEAGGIIWRDGSGMNYGRDEDARRPEFNYMRDVDYCSGACIMVPKALFEQVGGFDERFAPAYYEDTDLAFAIRSAGYRVIYQPFSVVIHHEGVTSGTDTRTGVKAYQVRNQGVFHDKWETVLEGHGANGWSLFTERERGVGRRALVIDVVTPLPDKDSGSIDTIYQIRALQRLGYKVTFLPDNLDHFGRYTEALQRIGVEALYKPYIQTVAGYLAEYGKYFDIVVVKRLECGSLYIDDVRRYCKSAKVIYDTVDLHFLRERRHAESEQSDALARQAERTKATEVSVMLRADVAIVISPEEEALLTGEFPSLNVATIPYAREVFGCRTDYEMRQDIVFIGGFLHAPNVDAVVYFVNHIWPLVRSRCNDISLNIVGSNAPDLVRQLAEKPGVTFTGYVEELDALFDRCRLTVAPLRFGAGIKGKVGTSLSYGVPCVATSVAAEGMGLTHEQNILIGDTPEDMAEQICRVYQDRDLWTRLSEAGLEVMRKNYSFENAVRCLSALLKSLDLP